MNSRFYRKTEGALPVLSLAVRLVQDRAAAAVGAALFGLHPIHVEAVAWVSGVTDPLAALLMLASFISFLCAHDPGRKKAGWWGVSLVAYALAMMSKETALVLPALIFVYAWIWWPLHGSDGSEPVAHPTPRQFLRVRDSMLQAAPFLALTAAYIPLRIHALGGFSHALTPVPLATSILTWPTLLWFYAGKLVWPAHLS